MQESSRYLCLFLIALLFVLSFSFVQCRSVLSETTDRQKRSLSNIDYINICMFRKIRLCDYLRELDNARFDEPREEPDLWKRGISQFYSNW